MEIDIKTLQRNELRSKAITVRTFPSYAKWLDKNKISPSRLFNKTIEQLMKKEK